MAKRVGNISSEQKKEIIEFMERNPALEHGKFNNDFTFKSARTLWMSLSDSLNAIPGAQKDWKQWRKAWQDLKGNAKKKGSALKTHFRQTGGGPPLTDIKITKEEQKVLDIIGTTATEGHPTIIESGCSFAFDANHGNESVILEYVVNPNMDHDYVHQSEALAGIREYGLNKNYKYAQTKWYGKTNKFKKCSMCSTVGKIHLCQY
ncbi:unnamed protein product [Brassicogethes aeneus]|uniref:Regulatory protein zeste n=1 Tax=Brassicogethes aeneus TaxID=1431903 RepID=A0A9P0FNC1_BRAAE|nr:unnamed protein product [Brassicogethes aeneus]